MVDNAIRDDAAHSRKRVTAAFPKRVFVEGDELYDAMLETIRGARHSVNLETYILSDDPVGRRFVHALAERAEAGVRVRLLIDAFGTLGEFPRRTARELTQAGVAVRRFHRWQWRDPLRYNRRDHRKLMVVDAGAAFLGGYNLHAESSRRHYGEGRWRDAHVQLGGALAREAEAQFDTFWYRRWQRHQALALPTADAIVSNHNAYARRRLRYLFSDIIDGARRRLWLTTPYFVPDRRTQKQLVAAVKRGVDVRVVGPRKTDFRLARWASHAAYATLLNGGVRIFEYLPRLLHAKTLVADGEWAVLGSSNLDYRSFRHNYEINLISADPALCARLEQEYLDDLDASQEILAGGWAKRYWFERLAEGVGWLARRWL